MKYAAPLLLLMLASVLPRAHAAPVSASPWILQRTVLLQRHGVRSPTDPPAALARYSAQPWPSWPVGPGELTDGGRRALAAMAAYIRERYVGLGVLPRTGCPASEQVYVWADSSDQRTRASGAIMAAGLSPGCSITAQHAASRHDPLFHPQEAGMCRLDAQAARTQILASVNGNLDSLGPEYEQARQALQTVLWPGTHGCGDSPAHCPMLHGRNELSIAHGKLKLTGPLKVGASLSEDLLLEYTAGLPRNEVGWGRAASPSSLAQILPLHVRYAELMRRSPDIAASGGTPLARLMLQVLEGRPAAATSAAAPPVPATAKLVVLAGHDTNLSDVGSILGLDWTLPHQPDSTAPDTTLALELWRNAHDGRQYVRAVVFYQTLDELRAEAMRTGAESPDAVAHALPLTFPGCTSSRCSLDVVRARIHAHAQCAGASEGKVTRRNPTAPTSAAPSAMQALTANASL